MAKCECLPCEICGATVVEGCKDPKECQKEIDKKYTALANDEDFQNMLGDNFGISL